MSINLTRAKSSITLEGMTVRTTSHRSALPPDLRLAFERLLHMMEADYNLPETDDLLVALRRVLDEGSVDALENLEKILPVDSPSSIQTAIG
ncbi:MAG: hypothetical protein HND57_14635 [Planctomycetes bacterium]|nr:hypothetical protein [Planctomycetota bacterium]